MNLEPKPDQEWRSGGCEPDGHIAPDGGRELTVVEMIEEGVRRLYHTQRLLSKSKDGHRGYTMMSSWYLIAPSAETRFEQTFSMAPKIKGYSFTHKNIDSFYTGLLFWDNVRFVWPDVGIGFTDPILSNFPQDHFIYRLIDAGIVSFKRPQPPTIQVDFLQTEAYGKVLLGPRVAKWIMDATANVLEDDLKNIGGDVTLASSDTYRLKDFSDDHGPALIANIHRGLPIIRDIADVDSFLKWKDERKVSLRRLLSSSSIVADRIIQVGDRIEDSDATVRDIKDAIDEIFGTSQSSGVNLTFGTYRAVIRRKEVSPLDALLHGLGAGGAASFILPDSAAASVGLSYGLRAMFDLSVEKRRLRKSGSESFPSEVYAGLLSASTAFNAS